MNLLHGYRPIQPPGLQKELQQPGYSYREYAPSGKLAPFVACYWSLDVHSGHGHMLHRIIPDGCVDIIVNRRSFSSSKAAFITGLMTRYEVMSLSRAESLFGVRLYTETADRILKCPVSAFLSHHVYLEEIWGAAGLRMAEALVTAKAVSDMITIMESQLKQLLSLADLSTGSLIQAGMKSMYFCKGNMTGSLLAEKLGYSERHVRRVFAQELGVSPKEMLGIVRFQCMLQELHSGNYSSLTEAAVNYGYYDQSHFIKSFKRYYGLLPKQLASMERVQRRNGNGT
ncbi:helix-turn-helix transcriptional regulator [Paenibacillus silviterrae]|uniref:helix-turn-helix transcriptional regulator n=1 Tax=Paenibacillus silviterrae TaxID=3242194 RepID=UPI0025438078|nr:helix-turn-helix transcriptional regulator [Paenibacillus chinjuensis]